MWSYAELSGNLHNNADFHICRLTMWKYASASPFQIQNADFRKIGQADFENDFAHAWTFQCVKLTLACLLLLLLLLLHLFLPTFFRQMTFSSKRERGNNPVLVKSIFRDKYRSSSGSDKRAWAFLARKTVISPEKFAIKTTVTIWIPESSGIPMVCLVVKWSGIWMVVWKPDWKKPVHGPNCRHIWITDTHTVWYSDESGNQVLGFSDGYVVAPKWDFWH